MTATDKDKRLAEALYESRRFPDGHGNRKWGVVCIWPNGKERRIGNTFPTRAQAESVADEWNRRIREANPLNR